MQLRVENGKASSARARASTGRPSSPRSPRPAPSPARLHHRWRGVRAGQQRRARLRRAAGGDAEGKTDDLVFFVVRSAVRRRGGLREAAADRAQGAAEGAARGRRAGAQRIRYVDHFAPPATRSGVGLPDGPRRHHLQATRCAVPLRPQRELDQVQVPRGAGGGASAAGPPRRRLPLAARRRESRRRAGLRRPHRHGLRRGGRGQTTARAKGARRRT